MRSLGCRCGNIKMSGTQLPSNVYPNICCSHHSDTLRLSECPNLIMNRGKFVQIQSPELCKTKIHSSTCADITCSACYHTLRFFMGQTVTLYVGAVEPKFPQLKRNVSTSEKLNRKLFCSLPIPNISILPNKLPLFVQPFVQVIRRVKSKRLSESNQIITFEEEEEEEVENFDEAEDQEIELMFSCKIEPFVGSFRPPMSTPDPKYEFIPSNLVSSQVIDI